MKQKITYCKPARSNLNLKILNLFFSMLGQLYENFLNVVPITTERASIRFSPRSYNYLWYLSLSGKQKKIKHSNTKFLPIFPNGWNKTNISIFFLQYWGIAASAENIRTICTSIEPSISDMKG